MSQEGHLPTKPCKGREQKQKGWAIVKGKLGNRGGLSLAAAMHISDLSLETLAWAGREPVVVLH
jgi:hypothetical protein